MQRVPYKQTALCFVNNAGLKRNFAQIYGGIYTARVNFIREMRTDLKFNRFFKRILPQLRSNFIGAKDEKIYQTNPRDARAKRDLQRLGDLDFKLYQ